MTVCNRCELGYPLLATASGFDRFLACRGSAVLPQVRDPQGVAAAEGTADHAFKLQPSSIPAAVVQWFGSLPTFEVALAADCSSEAAQYLGRDIARAYPLMPGPCWIGGSADAMRLDGWTLSVCDLKTGRGQSRGGLPRPAESGQLLGLAWLAVRVIRERKKQRDWLPERVRLAWWFTAEGIDELEDAELSGTELRNWGERLEAVVRRAWSSRHVPSLSRGPHCGGCSARDACPAFGGAVRRLRDVGDGAQQLSAEDYAQAWLDLDAAERACSRAKEALLLRVQDGHAVTIGDHSLRLIQGTTSRLDPDVAAQVLTEAELKSCVTVTLSKEGLRRGLGEERIDDVVEAIRQKGGVVTVPKAPHLRLLRDKR